MLRKTVVLAQLEVHGCTAELQVNGIPVSVVADEPDRVPRENVAVEQLLIPGANTLELWVSDGSNPEALSSPRREVEFRPMRAIGRLLRFDDGSDTLPEHGDLLLEVAFEWAAGAIARQSFPLSRSRGVDLGKMHGRWGWQDAPALVLEPALVDEACAVMDELEAAVRAGDQPRFEQLWQIPFDDAQRAYPALKAEALRLEMVDLLEACGRVSEPVPQRDRSRHAFRLVARGKLVELLDADHTPSFKLVDAEGSPPMAQPLMLGRMGGRLRVVR